MAHKRTSGTCEDIIASKVSKLREENDCDVSLDSVTLSSDLEASLEYDSVLKSFSISLDKQRKEGNRFISFGEEEMRNIVKLLLAIENLERRYSSKRSPKLINIPFEACTGTSGDLVTLVSMKENTFKRGQFDVDIRKCMMKEDSEYQYTSEGVRCSVSLLSSLRGTLLAFQSLIEQVSEKTRGIISMTLASSMIRQIQELSDPRQLCHGCQIDHPSQTEHMGYRGCLALQQPSWSDAVSEYWRAAKSLITEDFVQNLAKQAAARIPELQKYFMQGLTSMTDIQDGDLKELVLRREKTEENQLFKILSDI